MSQLTPNCGENWWCYELHFHLNLCVVGVAWLCFASPFGCCTLLDAKYSITTKLRPPPLLICPPFSSKQMNSEDPQLPQAQVQYMQPQGQPQQYVQVQGQPQYVQVQAQPQVQYMQPQPQPQIFQGQYGQPQQPVQPQFGQAQPQVQYMQLQGQPQMVVQPQQLAQPTLKPEGPQDCCMCSAPPELQQWLRIASGVTLFFAIPQVICAAVTYDYVTTPKLGAWWLIFPSVITCILGLLSIARYIFHLTEVILNRS
jgi:hypothetical protein